VNRFTLRGSWASLGDQAVPALGRYPFFPALGTTPMAGNWLFAGNRQMAVSPGGIVNPHLTWATITTVGGGVDIGALNNRLEFSYDWFRRTSSDFISLGAQLPAVLGAGAPLENNAEIQTTGWEISMGWRDRIGGFTYGARFVLSDHIGRITRFDGNPNNMLGTVWAYAGQNISFREGMTLGEIWGFETYGIFQSQEEIDNAPRQNQIWGGTWGVGDVRYRVLADDRDYIRVGTTYDDPGDLRIIGNSTPRFQYGLTLFAEYRGFDFSTFFQGVGRRDIMFYSTANFFWGFTQQPWQSSYFTVHQDRWTPENPNGFFPRALFGGNADHRNRRPQTRFLQSAAYLRWKNLQIGYTLPMVVTDRIGLSRVRVFANVENLATHTNLINVIDPEIAQPHGRVYPLRRTWAFGTNITF
jgi:hypothetical protein